MVAAMQVRLCMVDRCSKAQSWCAQPRVLCKQALPERVYRAVVWDGTYGVDPGSLEFGGALRSEVPDFAAGDQLRDSHAVLPMQLHMVPRPCHRDVHLRL